MQAAGHDLPGLARACRALAAGAPAIVPNPAPMSYGIVATDAERINLAKGRPRDQSVGVSVHDAARWARLVPCLDLGTSAQNAVAAFLARRLTVLVPVHAEQLPPWAVPAVREGNLAVFNGAWDETAAIWARFAVLYGSSANPTGELPAESAARARSMFGTDCAIVDADAAGDTRRRLASTMVRIDRNGTAHLHRSGAQDAAVGPPRRRRQ